MIEREATLRHNRLRIVEKKEREKEREKERRESWEHSKPVLRLLQVKKTSRFAILLISQTRQYRMISITYILFISFVFFHRRYQLVIVQQPSRARMCGFGDKDRRPISPPPIVKMIIYSLEGRVVPAALVSEGERERERNK